MRYEVAILSISGKTHYSDSIMSMMASHITGLLNTLFRHISKKTSKLNVTGLCTGNSPVTCEFPDKGPVTWKMFPFDDVITLNCYNETSWGHGHFATQTYHFSRNKNSCHKDKTVPWPSYLYNGNPYTWKPYPYIETAQQCSKVIHDYAQWIASIAHYCESNNLV